MPYSAESLESLAREVSWIEYVFVVALVRQR